DAARSRGVSRLRLMHEAAAHPQARADCAVRSMRDRRCSKNLEACITRCPRMPTSRLPILCRNLSIALAATSTGVALAATEAPGAVMRSAWHPSAVFLQVGDGNHTQTVTAGFSWDLPWQTRWAGGTLSAYVDASLGRWWIKEDGVVRSPWVTQLGL